jgi:SSS family solute:Na+ symporter
MTSLITGFVLGMARLVLELNKASLDGFLFAYANINFLHFAIILFVVCSVVLVVASLLSAPPPAEKVAGLTFAKAPAGAVTHAAPSPRRRADLVLTGLLILCVAAVWIYFS